MNIHEIEQAAFTSCPVQEQSLLAGCLLRSNGGYTKRANSANLIADQAEGINPARLIRDCESYFSSKGLPSIFRLLSVFHAGDLDHQLEAKGYRMIETTNVMVQSLAPQLKKPQLKQPQLKQPQQRQCLSSERELVIEDSPLPEWINCYYQMSDDNKGFQDVHLSMLQSVTSPVFAAVIKNSQGVIVSMGIGVVVNGYFGIFNIVTANEFKQQGYSYALISDLLIWARAAGAHTAYVQVRQANLPGVNLYQKLGYEEGYQYWYRVGGEQHVQRGQ